MPLRTITAACIGAVLMLSACGDSSDVATAADTGIQLVAPEQAAALQDEPPTDLVVLDVRTPDEFAEGHLPGAVLIDFYDEDFAEQLAGLDPTVPYLVYCRSGNRSGQATTIMADLGFVAVTEVDGGIIAWTDADLPVVTP